MFYIVKCEIALLSLPDIEKPGCTMVHCDSILIQRPTLTQTNKAEQKDSRKGTYEHIGLTDNTYKAKHTTDIEQYFVDGGEKNRTCCMQ